MALAVSVIVMAYNEASSLEFVVREIISTLDSTGREYEVLIIDDGSSDGTGAVAEQLKQKFSSLKVCHHPSNLGLGGVYRTGFIQAQKDLITFFPADGQFPPSIILKFLPCMDTAELVLGFLPHRDSSLLSKLLSKAERLLYRLLFGYKLEFQGVFMFKRELLREFELKSSGRGWAVVMEFVIRTWRSGDKVISVPIELRPRMSGKSKVNNLPTIVANLKQVFLLRRYL